MDNVKNPAFVILGGRDASSSIPALMDDETTMTFQQLRALSFSYAQHFVASGVGPASLIALSSADPAVVVASTLASGLLGCRMIFPSPDTLTRLLPEISHCFETKDAPLFGEDLFALIDETWSVPPKGAPTAQIEDFPGCASPQDEWLIFGTSGTTGRKKFVPLTFQALHRRSEVEAALLPESQTRMVCLFGITSAAFMQRVFSAFYMSGTIVRSADPVFWQKAHVTRVFASPAQIRTALTSAESDRLMPQVCIGGGGISDNLAEQLFDRFNAVDSLYGATETGPILRTVLSRNGDKIVRTQHRLETEIQIVDEADNPLPAGQPGQIRMRNDRLGQRYLSDPGQTAATFRHGYFYPADYGCLTHQGDVELTGRAADQFNLQGIKIDAAALDDAIIAVDGVRDAITFLVPRADGEHRLTAMLQIDKNTIFQDIVSNIRIRLMQLGGGALVPEKFFQTGKMPRTANGKPDRVACLEKVPDRT